MTISTSMSFPTTLITSITPIASTLLSRSQTLEISPLASSVKAYPLDNYAVADRTPFHNRFNHGFALCFHLPVIVRKDPQHLNFLFHISRVSHLWPPACAFAFIFHRSSGHFPLCLLGVSAQPQEWQFPFFTLCASGCRRC